MIKLSRSAWIVAYEDEEIKGRVKIQGNVNMLNCSDQIRDLCADFEAKADWTEPKIGKLYFFGKYDNLTRKLHQVRKIREGTLQPSDLIEFKDPQPVVHVNGKQIKFDKDKRWGKTRYLIRLDNEILNVPARRIEWANEIRSEVEANLEAILKGREEYIAGTKAYFQHGTILDMATLYRLEQEGKNLWMAHWKPEVKKIK